MTEQGGTDNLLTQISYVIGWMELRKNNEDAMEFIWAKARATFEQGRPIITSFQQAILEWNIIERNS